jgi:lysyl-tRNA synthetase class I
MITISTPNTSTFHRHPSVVATGFTTAYLGDERSLREFIVGDHIRSQITQSKGNCILYLINDSYDPLNYRQLRVAVNKDEKLLAKFEHYCGCPIAEIPDPFGCHESYSQHFTEALLQRLHYLDIHPVVMDTYQAYQNGYYNSFIATTFENYSQIQEAVASKFAPFTMHNLFYVKCPQCGHMDTTHIHKVINGQIQVECKRCNTKQWYDSKEIQGKLSWKLDCAARWNLYGIDIETFSKNYLDPTGSFYVSKFISENFYGGRVPMPVKYGKVQIDKEMSYKLLEILPPTLLKKLFVKNFNRDIGVTKDSVENFCRRFPIRPGVSYVDYIQTELPKQAIRTASWENALATPFMRSPEEMLVLYGKRFSKFYYDRDYLISFPDAETIAAADVATARAARDIILNALSVRNGQQTQETSLCAKISEYLKDRNKVSTAAIQYTRRILGQLQGPRLSTLLALLPGDYLQMIQMTLSFYANKHVLRAEHCNHLDSSQGKRCFGDFSWANATTQESLMVSSERSTYEQIAFSSTAASSPHYWL